MKGLFLVSLIIPLISLADILWEDNFDSYQVGTDLDDSPYWEKLNQNLNGFKIKIQDNADKWVFANNSGIYVASGGAINSDMKISVREVNAPTISEYYWSSGGVITRLSKDGKGYAAIYKVDVLDLEVTYMCYIYIMIGNNGWEVVNSERLPGKIKIINITATGTNPVYISAWFDSYHLEYYDYKYKLTGEYGGMWVLCTMKGTFYMDDFVEESYGSSFLPTSIGNIKALFK